MKEQLLSDMKEELRKINVIWLSAKKESSEYKELDYIRRRIIDLSQGLERKKYWQVLPKKIKNLIRHSRWYLDHIATKELPSEDFTLHASVRNDPLAFYQIATTRAKTVNEILAIWENNPSTPLIDKTIRQDYFPGSEKI